MIDCLSSLSGFIMELKAIINRTCPNYCPNPIWGIVTNLLDFRIQQRHLAAKARIRHAIFVAQEKTLAI